MGARGGCEFTVVTGGDAMPFLLAWWCRGREMEPPAGQVWPSWGRAGVVGVFGGGVPLRWRVWLRLWFCGVGVGVTFGGVVVWVVVGVGFLWWGLG